MVELDLAVIESLSNECYGYFSSDYNAILAGEFKKTIAYKQTIHEVVFILSLFFT